MRGSEIEEIRDFWDRVASEWRIQVGDEGDANRRLNSDPVLWELAGDVGGVAVLDVGCGTGYLAGKLHRKGALVTGVDISSEMISIARSTVPEVEFRVDSASELATVQDESFDLVIANYVLMDTPDLEGTMRAFHRVLRPGGRAVLVFSHPCFPQARAEPGESPGSIRYSWAVPYFERRKCIDPPWGHFTSDFIWFHRPLSDYWKAFVAAGLVVCTFEEPRLTPDRYHLAGSQRELRNGRSRPYSVAFELSKERSAGAPPEAA